MEDKKLLELPSRPDKHIPLCWEDAVSRSKTICLDNKHLKGNSDTNKENKVDIDLNNFYLPAPFPKPPLLTPFRGMHYYDHTSRNLFFM